MGEEVLCGLKFFSITDFVVLFWPMLLVQLTYSICFGPTIFLVGLGYFFFTAIFVPCILIICSIH